VGRSSPGHAMAGRVRETDPKRWRSLRGGIKPEPDGWWAKQFGTPNFAAHGGSARSHGNSGLYSIGGSFWEFGEPDWDRTKYLLMFGVAET